MSTVMAIKNIIFDLGGVLLNISYQVTINGFKKLGVKDFDSFYNQAAQMNLFDQFDKWDRWKTEVQRRRPFDIREHTEALRELTTAAEQLNEMLATSRTLLGSPEWGGRIEEASEAADGRITAMADQSRVVLNAFYWRALALMGVLFIVLILYRLISIALMRRFEASRRGNQHHDAAEPRR